jgi:hypothetical protein
MFNPSSPPLGATTGMPPQVLSTPFLTMPRYSSLGWVARFASTLKNSPYFPGLLILKKPSRVEGFFHGFLQQEGGGKKQCLISRNDA